MYEYIKGEIAELTPACAVIEAGGVGYYLNISLNTYTELQSLREALVYVHFVVREDAQVMYGFSSREERELFRRLIGVSGVGGNTARMVLSTYAPREVANIIATGNDTLLRNVKGLGLKTAQKIIVELKDKVVGVGASVPAAVAGGAYDEALAALTMLGFARAASAKAVETVIRENPSASVEEVVRQSLKKL